MEKITTLNRQGFYYTKHSKLGNSNYTFFFINRMVFYVDSFHFLCVINGLLKIKRIKRRRSLDTMLFAEYSYISETRECSIIVNTK